MYGIRKRPPKQEPLDGFRVGVKVQTPDGRVGKIHTITRNARGACVRFVGQRLDNFWISALTIVPNATPMTREDGRPRGADLIPEVGARVVTTCYGDGENSRASVEQVTTEQVFLKLDPDTRGTSWRGWFKHDEYRVL